VLVTLSQDSRVVEYPQSSSIYGIHIIQDRVSGKTHEVYVELEDLMELDKVLRRFHHLQSKRREPKMGTRKTLQQSCSNSQLMKAIFPHAKCEWVDGQPVRSEQYLQNYPSEWNGFITPEELHKVSFHVEEPNATRVSDLKPSRMCFLSCFFTNSEQSRFAAEAPERVYQFMMSSLQKVSNIQFYFTLSDITDAH
jgi:hypothetical protein